MRQIGYGDNMDVRADDQVWVEVEMAADVDCQEEAENNPTRDIPTHIPTDGYYTFATNPTQKKTKGGTSEADKTKADWYVAGAFKVTKILSDAEADAKVDEYNKEHGTNVPYDFRRAGGKVFDGEKLVDRNNDTDPTTPCGGGSGVRYFLYNKNYSKIFTNSSRTFTNQVIAVKKAEGLVRDDLDKLNFRIVDLDKDPVQESNISGFVKRNIQGELYWHNDPTQKVIVNSDSVSKFASVYNGLKKRRNDLLAAGDVVNADKLSREINAYLRVLSKFKEVFNASELVETHNDYDNHDNDNMGTYSINSLIHRLFSAVRVGDEIIYTKFMKK